MEKKRRRFRLTISWKTTILIAVLGLVVVEVAMLFFTIEISKKNRSNYETYANNLAATVSNAINVDDFLEIKGQVKSIVDDTPNIPIAEESDWESQEWIDYISKFEAIPQTDVYKRTLKYLQGLQNANNDMIGCIYLSYVDYNRELCVYVIDAAFEDACTPGTCDLLYDVNKEVITNPSRGFPAYVTETVYGWLVTSGSPIIKDNEVVGYAFVDISMAEVRKQQANEIVTFFIHMILSIAGVAVIGIIVVHFVFIKPIRKLTDAANSYDISDSDGTHEKFEKLNIKVSDEVGDLATAMKRMEGDVNYQIHKLTEANQALVATQKQAQEMKELADNDPLTNVGSKVAYAEAVNGLNEKIKNKTAGSFAIIMIDLNYLKEINDNFGHVSGDEALVKLSALVKDTFIGFPVYRIGGDEFVVLANNISVVQLDQLVEKFNKEVEKLHSDKPENIHEPITAAIGYAFYDEANDYSVDDVFKHADDAMYHHKRVMKEKLKK